MKIAVISDIHGNMEAFKAVLKDISSTRVTDIFSLGDNIGYGAESEIVIQELIKRGIPSVMGNHELVVSQPEQLGWFNPVARYSLGICLAALSTSSLEFIKQMPSYMIYQNIRFVHGFPPDSVDTYLFQADNGTLRKQFSFMREWICFVGHTHHLRIIEFDGASINIRQLNIGNYNLNPQKKYIINIGSVGQPRDGDSRAKYLIMNLWEKTIDLRAVKYDIVSAADKIIEAGLPKAHATRLFG